MLTIIKKIYIKFNRHWQARVTSYIISCGSLDEKIGIFSWLMLFPVYFRRLRSKQEWQMAQLVHKNCMPLPGDSCSLIICLSVNWERLWTKVKQWFVLQLVQRVGSVMRPLSISTVVVNEQTIHLKKASRISGIILDVRMTIPLIVISWSISVIGRMPVCDFLFIGRVKKIPWGFKALMFLVLSALNGRTCIWCSNSAAGYRS